MILKDEAATEAVGAALAKALRPGDAVTLSGQLGVGKTALARAVIRALGYDGEVPSPSFAIVQPYEEISPPVWHVDLYRIESRSELAEIGLDSISGAVLLIEWPERAGENSWPNALRLNLEFGQNGCRILTADVPPSWQGRWPTR